MTRSAMETQQPQSDGQSLLSTGEAQDVSHSDSSAGPISDMLPSEACVIKPNDEEKKRESERQAWFQNAVNERLNIPTGYLKVAVLVVRWHDEIDQFRKGHDEEASDGTPLSRLKLTLRR